MKRKNIIKVLKVIEQICRESQCSNDCCLKGNFGCGLIHGGIDYKETSKEIKGYIDGQNKNND